MNKFIFYEEEIIMNEKMVVREWYDEDNERVYHIRFIKVNDMWYAVLKDICDALGLYSWKVAQRIDVEFLLKRTVPVSNLPSRYDRCKGDNLTRRVTLVNEMGIYQCIAGSRSTEAKKFVKWYPQMISKLRKGIGLEGFMAMEMMDERVQKHIDEQLDRFIPEFDPYLDNVFYDEATGMLMQSVTVAGGDVEVVPYEGEAPYPYNLYSFR